MQQQERMSPFSLKQNLFKFNRGNGHQMQCKLSETVTNKLVTQQIQKKARMDKLEKD